MFSKEFLFSLFLLWFFSFSIYRGYRIFCRQGILVSSGILRFYMTLSIHFSLNHLLSSITHYALNLNHKRKLKALQTMEGKVNCVEKNTHPNFWHHILSLMSHVDLWLASVDINYAAVEHSEEPSRHS